MSRYRVHYWPDPCRPTDPPEVLGEYGSLAAATKAARAAVAGTRGASEIGTAHFAGTVVAYSDRDGDDHSPFAEVEDTEDA